MAKELRLGFRIGAQGADASAKEIALMERAIRELKKENEAAARTAAKLKDAYNLNDDEVAAVARRMEQLAAETRKAEEEAQQLELGLAEVSATSASLAAGIGAAFVSGLQAFSQFEQFEGLLETALGSPEAAQEALAAVERFAATTPFQLDEVVQAFIKLQNRGIEPTNDVLRQLGDLASSQSKSLDQVVEAVLDASTGEFERLKEFGIQASSAGDQVTISFRGAEQTIAKTPEAISQAVISLGALEGIAGGMARQSETLAGQFSNLQDEATKAGRAFGGFAATGARPVVVAGIGLLRVFNSLPGPIQAALLATTGFVGVLAAAVAAITAYNLANGQRVVQEVLAVAGTIKNTAATTAKTAAVTAATAAQSLYATVTGQATAAQIAQTKALAVGTAVFAGAVASVALVADTLSRVTGPAAEIREQIESVDQALVKLSDSGAAAGQGLAEATGTEAERNLAALEQGIGGVQRALDTVIRGPIPGLPTALEAAVSRAEVAFAELLTKTDDVRLSAAQVAVALEQGLDVDPSQIEATVEAIDASIAALEQQRPVQEAEIERRDAQIAKLQEYRDRITATTEGTVALGEATGGLTDRLNDLGAALDASIGAIDLAKLQQQAAILEQLAQGDITQQQADTQLATLDTNALRDTLSAQQQALTELRELRAEAEAGSEQAAELDAEILQRETQVARTRVGLARQVLSAKQESEQAAAEAAQAAEQKAQEAAQKAYEQRIAIAEDQADKVEQSRERERETAEQAFKDQADAAQQAFDDETTAAKRAFDDRVEARKITLDQEIAQIEQARDASIQAIEQELSAREAALDAQIQLERAALNERQAAERSAAEERFSAEEQRIERQLQLRNAESPEARAELQARFEEEDRLAAQREKAFANLNRQRAEFEAQQAQEREAQAEAERRRQEELAAQRQIAEAETVQLRQAAEAEITQRRQESEAQILEQRRAFEDQELQRKRDFEAQRQASEAAFNAQQRQLDEASSARAAQIIASARATAPTSLRTGGPVEPGRLYQVHKDEFFVPSQPGTILNQADSRALVRETLTARQVAEISRSAAQTPVVASAAATPRSGSLEITLKALLKEVKQGHRTPIQGGSYTFVNEPDPWQTMNQLQQQRLRSLSARLGL